MLRKHGCCFLLASLSAAVVNRERIGSQHITLSIKLVIVSSQVLRLLKTNLQVVSLLQTVPVH